MFFNHRAVRVWLPIWVLSFLRTRKTTRLPFWRRNALSRSALESLCGNVRQRHKILVTLLRSG